MVTDERISMERKVGKSKVVVVFVSNPAALAEGGGKAE